MPIKKKQMEYQPHGEVSRVISLNNGEHAYVINEKGKLKHLKTNTKEFIDVCAEADSKLGGWIERDLRRLGWDDKADLVAAQKGVESDE